MTMSTKCPTTFGEWGAELEEFEAAQAKDKQEAEQQARAWRK